MKSIAYELHGESFEAADTVYAYGQAFEDNPPLRVGGGKEVAQSWAAFREKFIEVLKTSHPDLFEKIGLQAPYIQIRTPKDAFPRAYKIFPNLYKGDFEERYFVLSPVDYQDRHFVPQDATQLSDEEIRQIYLQEGPVVITETKGIAIPSDLKYSTKFSSMINSMLTDRPTRTNRVFAPEGRTLEIVHEYLQRKEEYETLRTQIWDEIRRIGRVLFTELNDPDSEYYISPGAFIESGITQFTVNLQKRPLGDFLPIPENPYFHLEKDFGDKKIVPREDTVEGSVFADLLHSLPLEPSLKDYPELFSDYVFEFTEMEKNVGANSIAPQLTRDSGLMLLLYHGDDKAETGFCPPGAKPVSSALYQWLQADTADRNMRILPPPMPEEIGKEFTSLTLKQTLLKKFPGLDL